MIVYGTGGGRAVLGEAGRHTCPACEKESVFMAVVDYSYAHVWYLLSFLTGRSYFAVCSGCGNVTPIDAKTTRAQFPKDNIPFVRKRGWMLVLGLVGVIVAYAAVSDYFAAGAERANREKMRGAIDAPRVGDVYLANLALIEGSGFELDEKGKARGQAFGTLLLTEIEDGEVVLFTSLMAKSKRRELEKEYKATPQTFQYDPDEPVYMTHEEMKRLFDKGVIFQVVRKE